MDASKVSVSKDNLNNPFISGKHKVELRAKALLDYVDDHVGETVTLEQLGQAARYKNPQTVYVLVKKLLSDGRLIRESVPGTKSYTYWSSHGENVKTSQLPAEEERFVLDESEPNNPSRVPVPGFAHGSGVGITPPITPPSRSLEDDDDDAKYDLVLRVTRSKVNYDRASSSIELPRSVVVIELANTTLANIDSIVEAALDQIGE